MSGGRLWTVLLVLPAFLVQFAGGKSAAYIAVWAVFLCGFIAHAFKGSIINKSLSALFLVSALFIAYQLRGDGFIYGGGWIDAMYTIPVLGAILFAATYPNVNGVLVFKFLVFGSSVIAAICIYSHFVQAMPEWMFYPPYAGTRWVGGFDGPNEFSQFYALMVGIALGLFMCGQIKAPTFLLASALCGACVWFGYSRGALMSLAITFVATAGVALVQARQWRVLSLFVLACVISAPFFDDALSVFTEIRRNSSGRDDLVLLALSAFQSAPIVGGGFGYFNIISTADTTTPHSDYLYFLVSGGIIAIASLILAGGYILYLTYRRKMYVEFLFFVMMAAHALTFNNVVRGRVSIVLWVVLALVLAELVKGKRLGLQGQDAGSKVTFGWTGPRTVSPRGPRLKSRGGVD